MEDNLTPTPSQETPAIKPAPEEEEVLSEKPARSKKWYIIGAVLVIFLAAAAFLGARLLKPQGAANAAGGNQMVFTSKGGPGGGSKSVRINMTPAKEVPQTRPDASGLFVRREDQSIFIGTGNVRMMVKAGPGGPADASASYDGPVIEVVVTHETKVYQDLTDMNPGNMENVKNGSEMKIQQVMKPGSLDNLGKNSMVTVWGDKQGDRYIAKVVVFR